MKIKKIICIILGFIFVAIGAIGVVLPMLPSFPFLMIATICFSKSSEKLNLWFTNTNLYKNNLESYVQGRGMTKATKLKILSFVTILLSIAFFMMRNVIIGQVAVTVIWIFHILYFVFGIKTLNSNYQNYENP